MDNKALIGFISTAVLIGGWHIFKIIKSNTTNTETNNNSKNVVLVSARTTTTTTTIQEISTTSKKQSQQSKKPRQETICCVPDIDDECECKFGLKRDDFVNPEKDLLGTIDYDKHILICSNLSDWEKDVEKSGLIEIISTILKQNRELLNGKKVKVTICSEPPSTPIENGFDVLIFPDMIRYNSLKQENIQNLIENQIAKGTVCKDLQFEKLSGAYVFVCTHNNRDKRCGVCGSRVLNEFNNVLNSSKFDKEKNIVVRGVSCIGSHKYAANVLIYNSKGSKCFGDLYGYVAPSDAERLVSKHILQEEIQKDIWRGRMGLSKEMNMKLLKFVNTNQSEDQVLEN